jgi:hypothetical protein
VTGIDRHIDRKSNKVSQATAIVQEYVEDESNDRVVVVVNAFKSKPRSGRLGKPVTTPEAERIFVGLNAVVIPAELLYDAWVVSSAGSAKLDLLSLIYSSPPGTINSL